MSAVGDDRRQIAAAEQVEHVAPDGTVIEIVSRADLRARGLRHRCIYVAVLRSDDRLVVHKRADWKDVYPGWWDLCFGGICDVSESWIDAAHRELAEEAGLAEVELEHLGSISYDGSDGAVVGEVYLARTDEQLTCPDGEVAVVDTVKLAELGAWLEGRDVCCDSREGVLPLLMAL